MSSQTTAGSRAAVVYNPVKVSLDRLRSAVGREENRRGWQPSHWFATRNEDGGYGAAEDAIADGAALILVAGGDGTVRVVVEAAEAAGANETPLGLLPAGTGNLLARSLGLPLNDISASVAVAFGGATRTIDVGVAELDDDEGARRRHLFLVMAGIGLDAEMAENTGAVEKRRLGWFAYVRPIARSIIANRVFRLHYRIDDGRVHSARAHTVIVGNCGTLTGGIPLLPSAVIDDGLLDVVLMRPKNWFGWARIGTRLSLHGIAHRSAFGKGLLRLAPEIQALAYAQGRQFDVRFDVSHGVELDGDSFGPVIRARITVRHAALRIHTEEAMRENGSAFHVCSPRRAAAS
ncbi:transcriptional regulator [Microbacterium sp. SYP-A9085]|uniref:diacylglycerol/lipid kinase family protein n=1 Tax=Microbacterium sp. SYP-A9085 TaxID=2664454 RepID=UPI00129AE7D0|nr:diacylglycerol kinase family protein [Microbacterium sp. SYP-A9085]MRH30325.1 transcriptional regulator [Microbacterium sp. SYP-A9085]